MKEWDLEIFYLSPYLSPGKKFVNPPLCILLFTVLKIEKNFLRVKNKRFMSFLRSQLFQVPICTYTYIYIRARVFVSFFTIEIRVRILLAEESSKFFMNPKVLFLQNED